jgi:hypothetical protein
MARSLEVARSLRPRLVAVPSEDVAMREEGRREARRREGKG